MLDYIKTGWKWLVGVIGVALVTLLISYVFQLVLKRRILFWFWRLVKRFAHLLIIHWISLVFTFFFILIWILYRRTNLWVIHWVVLSSIFFATIISILYRRICHIERYATSLDHKLRHLKGNGTIVFEEDFKTDLEKNWHYEGQWKTISAGRLSVTQSETGGITKVGHLWTDYSFEFTAVIVHQCIGWLVRAQDLANYYMIQLNATMVRPHLRLLGKWIVLDENLHNLSIQPDKPIDVYTEVRNLGISVYINGVQIFHEEQFFSTEFIKEKLGALPFGADTAKALPFTKGRVGFRMYAQEHGIFSQCRVRVL